MPGPAQDMQPWWKLMGSFPVQWATMTKRVLTPESPALAQKLGAAGGFRCPDCPPDSKLWTATRALQSHRVRMHAYRGLGHAAVDTSVCPVRHRDFDIRLRLLDHLRYRSKRCRGKTLEIESTLPNLAPERRAQLDAEDASLRRTAKAAGRSHLLASFPPFSHEAAERRR